jgi:hypothetical protein
MAANVYNNANKISNLFKGKPIGCVACGAGSIGNASISTLLKDFRKDLLEGKISGFDPKTYTMRDVSQWLIDFLASHVQRLNPNEPKPTLGLMVAGYSAGNGNKPTDDRPASVTDGTPGAPLAVDVRLGEVWSIGLQNGVASQPQNMRPSDPVGISWAGEAECVARILMGFSPRLPQLMQRMIASSTDHAKLMTFLMNNLQAPVVFAPMPIQDTIDLAEWLVQTSIMFSRFSPGAPVVGGPIESAAITKHEGFKWVHRKHYFQREFNQEDSINEYSDRHDTHGSQPRTDGD